MLEHHVRFLFCRDDFFDVSGVDITVGGDHGKGKSLNCFRSNYYYIYIISLIILIVLRYIF
jgi:hypothetical protein